MRRAAVLGAAAALLVPAAATAKPITKGVITVGQGVNGATLGMNRAQVVAKLGKPLDENPQGVMSYANTVSSGNIFDVYRQNKTPAGRVRLFIISYPGKSGFTLQDGNHVFANGGMARVMNRYGKKLTFVDDPANGPVYELTTRLNGRKVLTDFQVDKKGKDAHVLDIDILYA